METIKLLGYAAFAVIFFAYVGFMSVEYFLDDTPTEGFTRAQVEKRGATKIIKIFDRFEKSEGYGRQKIVLYNYRSFHIEKDLELNGQKIPHRINGQVRCYPDSRTFLPFDSEPEETYCQYHELERFSLEKKETTLEHDLKTKESTPVPVETQNKQDENKPDAVP